MCEKLFIIEEASNSERTFKCPFCTFRGTREELVGHVDDEHEDMIPEGYTAARVVFNHINKKEHGNCVTCRRETPWDENNWKYSRFCTNPRCPEIYVENFRKNMIGKHGKVTLLNDPEHQKKMLANRKISGQYRFQNGTLKSYTGSYEKNRLEFMDKTLNVDPKDIQSPGPVIEYEFNGEKKMWITDSIYIPFNLVIDDKDGGDNPNTHHNLEEYRAKQEAKEKAIMEAGVYNYIRLTNNDFGQLLEAMMEIKKRMLSDDAALKSQPLFFINESASELMNFRSGESKESYFIAYGTEYTIEGVGYCDSLLMDKFIVPDMENMQLVGVDRGFFKDKSCYVFSHTSEDKKNLYESLLMSALPKEEDDTKIIVSPTIIPSIFIGEEIPIDELFDDSRFERVSIIQDMDKFNIESILKEMGVLKAEDTLSKVVKDISSYKFEVIAESYLAENIQIIKDINGFYAMNINNGKRTLYHESQDAISNLEIRLIEGGY